MGRTRKPSGIVTLLTDFGLDDPFVGVMKGVILGRFAEARIVDLTHAVRPQDVVEGAFWLAQSYSWFPPGTVHVAVVDPGVGTDRGALVLVADDHFFVGPDNGIMEGVFERAKNTDVREIDLRRFDLPPPSCTFHGRDVFAPVAAELASGRRAFERVGPQVSGAAGLPEARVRSSEAGLEGMVVTIDHFGNLITNLEAAVIGDPERVRVRIGREHYPLRRTYGEVEPGQVVALMGSFGTLEIACRDGDAASVLGAERGTAVVVESAPKRR